MKSPDAKKPRRSFFRLRRIPVPGTKIELGVYSTKEVVPLTTLSRATIYRLEAEGKFPRRILLSDGRVGWLKHEVQNWIAARVRDARKAPDADEAGPKFQKLSRHAQTKGCPGKSAPALEA